MEFRVLHYTDMNDMWLFGEDENWQEGCLPFFVNYESTATSSGTSPATLGYCRERCPATAASLASLASGSRVAQIKASEGSIATRKF